MLRFVYCGKNLFRVVHFDPLPSVNFYRGYTVLVYTKLNALQIKLMFSRVDPPKLVYLGVICKLVYLGVHIVLT